MSVPKHMRKAAKCQFVWSAAKLHGDVISWTVGRPKRWQFQVWNPICEHMGEVVYHLNAANRISVRDAMSFAEREVHLKEGLAHLDHVESCLMTAYHVTMRDEAARINGLATDAERAAVKRAKWGGLEAICDGIDEVRALTRGVMRSDRERFSSVGQDGARPVSHPVGRGPRTTGGSAPSTATRTSGTSTAMAASTTTTRPTATGRRQDPSEESGHADAVTAEGGEVCP